MQERKQFTREFKGEAVLLMEEGKKPRTELARELGIKRNQLYKWKEEIEKQRGKGVKSAFDLYSSFF